MSPEPNQNPEQIARDLIDAQVKMIISILDRKNGNVDIG